MSTTLPKITPSESAILYEPSVLDHPLSYYALKAANSSISARIQNKYRVRDPIHNDHYDRSQPWGLKSAFDPSLLGDLTRDCTLPVISGRNQDVSSISVHTVARLLCEEPRRYYIIIDCRYPYEYSGGHIKGAKNIYTRESLMKEFFYDNLPTHLGKIVLFYCEFSSRRGPSMYRCLRKKDRALHHDRYPTLYYPEMYVIEGGYKAFFSHYKGLCEPSNYIEMKDKRFADRLALYRVKCREEESNEKYKGSRLSLIY